MAEDDDTVPYERLIEDISHKGLVASVLSVAYELGMLELLAEADLPMTSQEVADARGLKERYVREALNCLGCAGVIHVTKNNNNHVTYHMTKKEAEVMQGPHAMMVGVLSSQATRYAGIMTCFERDGPYSLPSADDPWSQGSLQKTCRGRVEEEVDLVLREVAGLGKRLESGIKAIEFGSGGGDLLFAFAQKFPNSLFIGSEYTDTSIQTLRKSKCNALTNVEFQQLDLLKLPDDLIGRFDFAFVKNVIHDLPDPLGGLQGCHKALKPGSIFACFDIDCNSDVTQNLDNPFCAALYASSTFHCVPQAYQSSQSSVLGACWGRGQAMTLLQEAGFTLMGTHAHWRTFVLYLCRA